MMWALDDVTVSPRMYLRSHLRYAMGPIHGALYDLESARVVRVYAPASEWLHHLLQTSHWPEGMPELPRRWLEQSPYLTADPSQAADDPWLEAAAAAKRKMVWIELTEQCNYRCVHCYAGSGPELRGGLPDADILALVDEVAALGFPAIQFTGGDPTVHKRFMDFVERAHQRGIGYVEVYTNGANLRRAWLDSFRAWGTRLAISFYSADPSTYESITATPGSFRRAVNNIQLAIEMGIPVRIGLVLMRENEGHEAAARAYLQQLGVAADKIHADHVRPTGRGDGALIHAVSPYGQADSTVIPLASLRNMAESEPRQAPTPGGDGFPWAFYQLPTRFQVQGEQAQMNACWSGELVIAPTGQVYPCIFARTQPMGDVTQARLSQIIATEAVRTTWSHDLRDSEDCSVCEFRFACFDCRALTVSTTGRLNAKPPGCRYDPHTGVLASVTQAEHEMNWLDWRPTLIGGITAEQGYLRTHVGQILQVGGLGELLLAELDGQTSVGQLVQVLSREFADAGIPTTRIEVDVVRFVRSLVEAGLVQAPPGRPSDSIGWLGPDGATSLGLAPRA